MTKRLVVLPDIHTPNYDYTSINAVKAFIKYYKPTTLIQLGDFCDWDSVSSFEPNAEKEIQTLDKESDSSNQLLDELDKVLPKNCAKIMIAGNHEDRYAKFRINQAQDVKTRRMKTFTSWDDEYNLDSRGWESYDYGSHVKIGKIVFTHGWKNHGAKKMAEFFPGKNVIFGHLHRHEVHGLLDENQNPIESECIGTLSRFDLSYMRGQPVTNWVHSFMYIDMMDNGTFSKHFVHIINGQFIEHNRMFK